jgi:hypothetical protein
MTSQHQSNKQKKSEWKFWSTAFILIILVSLAGEYWEQVQEWGLVIVATPFILLWKFLNTAEFGYAAAAVIFYIVLRDLLVPIRNSLDAINNRLEEIIRKLNK